MANVKAIISLKARVAVWNATSGPREGKQWHDKWHCHTAAISKSEWDWRFAEAIAVLCGGTTTYTSYGDAIGHGWV